VFAIRRSKRVHGSLTTDWLHDRQSVRSRSIKVH
jgi:hypothetical protein